MSKSITLTISEDELAELEALLDAYLVEVRKDKGEHERVMARVDENLRKARKNLALLHANREIAERLRLALQLQHRQERQAVERENFRLQLENFILRSQRGLPPGIATPAEPQSDKEDDDEPEA